MHIYTHASCIAHEVTPGHPERSERLTSLLEHLQRTGITGQYPLRQASAASAEDLLRAHPQSHLDFIESMAPRDNEAVPVDPDTWMGPNSHSAALHAAGALCDAVDDVLAGRTTRVFCAVRPPGHHAEVSAAMGFCLYNSVAVGALKALADIQVNRVAILDFDVHHGNGTVDIFKDHPEVLVCSSFQHPHYPHRLHDLERPNIVNTPLPAGTAGDGFRDAIDRHWWPALSAHQPELIFISAGFDAHRADPLADLNLVEDDFAWVSRQIVSMADQFADGRVISTLEGGYDLHALASSVSAHLEVLRATC